MTILIVYNLLSYGCLYFIIIIIFLTENQYFHFSGMQKLSSV